MGLFEDIGYNPGLTTDTGIGDGLFSSIGYEPTLPLYEEEEAFDVRPVEEEPDILTQIEDFWRGAKIFGRQLPSMISDVIPETFYTAVRGGPDDLVDKGLLDRWITENKEERERVKTLTPEEREKTWFKIPFTDKKVKFGILY
ncbi:MAG: hypothetical protein GY757_36295 [bacterium]|nr:hypothetical protein [bacterium]